jgi:hypothetical protein
MHSGRIGAAIDGPKVRTGEFPQGPRTDDRDAAVIVAG